MKEFFLTVSIWLIVLESSRVDIAIAECILSKAVLSAIIPLTFVCLSILCQEHPNTMFLTIKYLPFVIATPVLEDFFVIRALHCLFLCLLKSLCKILLH